MKWKPRRFRKLIVVFAAIFVVAWIAGLYLFTTSMTRIQPEPPTADAIVALTGGDTRLEEAVYLLRLNKGERLLISGANPATTLADIQGLVNAPAFLFTCCIDIEHTAANTVGNATETAQWAHDKGYTSLIVVTADYHMPRSLLEFRRTMPDMTLIPYSIQSDRIDVGHWWQRRETITFMMSEYNKYLASLVRVQISALIR